MPPRRCAPRSKTNTHTTGFPASVFSHQTQRPWAHLLSRMRQRRDVAKLTTIQPQCPGWLWNLPKELGRGVPRAEKLADLFADGATEQHALRPERRRCLDS